MQSGSTTSRSGSSTRNMRRERELEIETEVKRRLIRAEHFGFIVFRHGRLGGGRRLFLVSPQEQRLNISRLEQGSHYLARERGSTYVTNIPRLEHIFFVFTRE